MSVDDDIDEKIQEAVEQKVEEERDRIKEEVREELLQEDAETSNEELDGGQNYSRRSFLKALGLGAGGLALSSAASADLLSLNRVAGDKTQNLGSILQKGNTASTGIDMNGNPITNSTGGPVDINADRLDGNQASNFATANDLYTDEEVQDTVASFVNSDSNLSWSYDNTNDTLTVSLTDSVSVNTLEATGSITDPEGNTVTSLSDPVRVTEEASTFTESNVNVGNSRTTVTNVSIQLTSDSILDDFEDGDIAIENPDWNDWGGDTGSFQAQTATVLDGTYSGEFTVNDTIKEISATRSGYKPNSFSYLIQIVPQTGDPVQNVRTYLGKTNDKGPYIYWSHGGDVSVEGDVYSATWNQGDTYLVEMTAIDFDSYTYDIKITNKDTSTVIINEQNADFNTNISDVSEFVIKQDAFGSSEAIDVYVDNVKERLGGNDGSAIVSFDGGAPEDIESYDLTTFQRTLDGETVTIDVEDSNDNVLKSDISKDTDISDIATSTDVQLRANLSRNDTANNPTVDYLARRFTR